MEVVGHTFFQLKNLAIEIDEQQTVDRRLLADTVRVANHGDRNEYERFIRSLEVIRSEEIKQPASLPASDGFVYTEE